MKNNDSFINKVKAHLTLAIELVSELKTSLSAASDKRYPFQDLNSIDYAPKVAQVGKKIIFASVSSLQFSKRLSLESP